MKEREKVIPCKDCLILPLCKNKKDKNITSCSLLKDWWYRPEGLLEYKKDLDEIEKYLIVRNRDTFTLDKSKWK